MRKNKFIPQVTNVLLILLFPAFYEAIAMESTSGEQAEVRSPEKITRLQDQIRRKVDGILENFRLNMEAYYRRTRVAPSFPKPEQPTMREQIRKRVNKILETFKDNMNAYYQRTRNTKRITLFGEEADSDPIFAEKGNLDSPTPTSLSAIIFPVDSSATLTSDFWLDSTGAEERQAVETSFSIPDSPQSESISIFSKKITGKDNVVKMPKKVRERPDKVIILDGSTPPPQIRSTSHLAEAKGIISQLPNLPQNLLPNEETELSELILEKLDSVRRNQFQFNEMKNRLTQQLNNVSSFSNAKSAIQGIRSPALSRGGSLVKKQEDQSNGATNYVLKKGSIVRPKTESANSESADYSTKAEEVMRKIKPLPSWGLTLDQKRELSGQISEKLNGLPQFQMSNMTIKIISDLNTVNSFEGAIAALESVKSPKVLLKREPLTEEEAERRETAIRRETIMRVRENSIAHDTKRVMEESGIASWRIGLLETDQRTIESDISDTVTKLYTGEIAKLGGAQDPLQPLVDFLKGAKKPEDVKTKLAEFESGNGFQTVVERGKRSEKNTNDMGSTSSTLNMEFRPMIAKQNNCLIKDINGWNVPSLLKFNNGQNATEAAKFEKLKKSPGTGFVYIQFGSHPNVTFQMNMKVFSLRIQKHYSLTLTTAVQKLTKSSNVINPQPYQEEEYYTVKLGQTSAEKLQDFGNCLGEGKYELWTVPGDEQRGRYFFAISREPEKPVISLTLTDHTDLSGNEDNYIDMARYLMSGSKETYVPKTVRRIKEANAKLSPEEGSGSS